MTTVYTVENIGGNLEVKTPIIFLTAQVNM